jgi:hypothetical protein
MYLEKLETQKAFYCVLRSVVGTKPRGDLCHTNIAHTLNSRVEAKLASVGFDAVDSM